MKSVILVSGCSITHGAELDNGFMSHENVKQSFSRHLANRLNLELVNVALSGGSNEYIFHSLIEELNKNNNIEFVLVVWTSTDRLYWKSKGRHWFVLPSWASSMKDLYNFEMHDKTLNGVWFTGDTDKVLEELEKSHRFFILNYFDNVEMNKKLIHYKQVLNDICKLRNIKLISIQHSDLYRIGSWGAERRHPNAEEHIKIADFIYDTYFKEKE